MNLGVVELKDRDIATNDSLHSLSYSFDAGALSF